MTESSNPKKMRPIDVTQWPPTSWLDPIDITRTGLQTVLAGLFGAFADKREVLAALYPLHEANKNKPGEIDSDIVDYSTLPATGKVWFDYIADTGDGWNPTYSIACLAGDSHLTVSGISESLSRGQFMILGGDQVYPAASAQQYRDRLEGPFFCARITSGKDRIPVFALPGNHDWYDGLTSFIRLFCQRGRWVGQWTASQTRSYFAIKLPFNWWIWGVDVQLESDLDVPQVEYFKRCAQDHLRPGHRVILVCPEPTWIEAGRKKKSNDGAVISGEDAPSDKGTPEGREEGRASQTEQERFNPSHRNLIQIERLIYRAHATVPIKIAGDLHHYAHYVSADQKSHLITCGGGGAFLHGTYGLPLSLELETPKKETFSLERIEPSEKTSKSLRKWVLIKLLIKNPWFAVAVGGIYWLYSWLLQSASEALDTLEWKTSLIPTLFDYLRTGQCITWESLYRPMADLPHSWTERTACTKVLWAWVDIVSRTPFLFVLTAIIIVGCGVFAAKSKRAGTSGPVVFIVGALHGAAHILLALVLIKTASMFIWANWKVHPSLLLGGVPGSILMAAYLWFANVFFLAHDQEVLSTQGIQDYKCFARFCLTANELKIYPIGLEKVCKKWDPAEGVVVKDKEYQYWGRVARRFQMEAPYEVTRIFKPRKPLNPRLLEPKPITIAVPPGPISVPGASAVTGSP